MVFHMTFISHPGPQAQPPGNVLAHDEWVYAPPSEMEGNRSRHRDGGRKGYKKRIHPRGFCGFQRHKE